MSTTSELTPFPEAAGFLALDYRGYGSSDGTPRDETDFYQKREDYRDAARSDVE